MIEETVVDRLVNHFGNQSSTAKALDVGPMVITQWVQKGYIPFHRGEFIESKTCGAIKAIEVWEAASKARHHKP